MRSARRCSRRASATSLTAASIGERDGGKQDPDWLALFLGFGYMGVPVAFALMAGVLVACALTPISMQSMVGQMFHGIDSEILLAVPFFLLVGELMTSANVTNRMIALAQTNPQGKSRQTTANNSDRFHHFFIATKR